MKISPMMQQYMDLKAKYKDCILFFRLGDFYEMFYDDAKLASRELELTLTGKNCGQDERAPMCGVPFHSAEGYIARLVERGYKVAICEQMEDPKLTKGLVRREVIRIVTPGTLTEQSMLREKENNYLAAIVWEEDSFALAYCDVSTGETAVTQYGGENPYETLQNELVKLHAREVLVSETFSQIFSMEKVQAVTGAFPVCMPDGFFATQACAEIIKSQFHVLSLAGLGLEEKPLAVSALGALFSYVMETQKQSLRNILRVQVYDIDGHMALDKATLRNLEITETLYERKVSGSLLGVLDRTLTAMGSRLMRRWLREPLNQAAAIRKRLDGVQALYDDPLLRNHLRTHLREIYDFARLSGRIACGNANGKDMIALRSSLEVLPELKSTLADIVRTSDAPILGEIEAAIDPLEDVCEKIGRAIVDDPPFVIREGGLIRPGYAAELDALKDSIKDGKVWIANLEGSERQRTGIRNLKVGYNRVFGYYLEVTKSFLNQVPDDYIRKQTLANAERYITPELKEMENLVLHAETKINQMEYDLFCALREEAGQHLAALQATSEAIAALDVLCAFAEVSERLGYVKPVIDESTELEIYKGRHPVIEQMTGQGMFISNDTWLNADDASMLLITGPNMAGKSTYMRQTALIVLMAQAGCFVPCERARIGVVDRIFTRIGASDNLSQGQSTFFVEMQELAYILNTAGPRSLVILDEIGRGTSTYDGLSIAWAAVEFLCNERTHIRTLFATHYHELTALEGQVRGLRNLTVDVAEENGSIVFLHRIIEGSASRSYGIHVARLAGVPESVLARAQDHLSTLEERAPASPSVGIGGADGEDSRQEDDGRESPERLRQDRHAQNPAAASAADAADAADAGKGRRRRGKTDGETQQVTLFDIAPLGVVERLKMLDLMEVTPSQAIRILEELKESIDD